MNRSPGLYCVFPTEMPMRVSRVFLRRYKSFNVSFGHYPDRRAGSVLRPWNATGIGKDGEEFGFIEIPIEQDVTTIVGANESGKSHLLSGLSKVLTGKGGPGDLIPTYGRTDLCHFPGASSANADVWPEIGVELTGLTDVEWKQFVDAAKLSSGNPSIGSKPKHHATAVTASDLP